MDIAQALVGKGDGSSSLYVKLFKLLLNLVMDVMMDRISKREASDQISLFSRLIQRPLLLPPTASAALQERFVS